MKKSLQIVSGAIALTLFALTANAQMPTHLRDYPLAAQKAKGDIVAPMFNGWIANEDGSVTYIFGFVNRNREEIVDIPIGPNNRIEPAQLDGKQPTHFPVYRRGGFVGLQERGVFAVTVPADMNRAEVVWTLTHAGHTWSVPARATSPAYEMSLAPAAFGSKNPAIRFDLNGPESTDRHGVYAARITTSVGKPVTLSAFVQDRGERGEFEVESVYPLGTEWVLHQGPATPNIEMAKITGRQRGASAGEDNATSTNGWIAVETQATFPEPGEYVMRLRVDNFEAEDSAFDYQCCWSNAYLPVTVTK